MIGDYKMIKLKKAAFLLTACFVAISSMPLAASSTAGPGIIQIATDAAPKAVGPYSQGIRAGSFIFVSGQIALNPTTGKLAGETIEEQTRQVFQNMEAILAAQGLTLENVVKTDVYLKSLEDFKAMNAIFAEKFSYEIKPARATIQAAKIPMDALVEISCVAFIPEM